MDADVRDTSGRSNTDRSNRQPATGHGRLPTSIGSGCLALALLFSSPASGSGAHSEEAVKSAYLYNFARYVEWPDSAFSDPDAPLVICVIGDDAFSKVAREGIGSRTVGSHGVEIASLAGLEDTSGCHILYLPESAGIDDEAVIGSLASKSIFTVSDSEGFARRGGIANFILVDRKIRFEINPDAADRAGLKVRARLLRVATVIS